MHPDVGIPLGFPVAQKAAVSVASNNSDDLTRQPHPAHTGDATMADHFYCRDRIRRNNFLHISTPFGSIGWFGVAALRDVCLVTRAI